MEYNVKFANFEIKITDSDIVNPDEIDSGYPFWILHEYGFTICAVWASNLQDAIDEAVDENKLDRFQLDIEDPETVKEYKIGTNDDTATYLGNACEAFDIESLGYVELAPPKTRSNCAEFRADNPKVTSYHTV